MIDLLEMIFPEDLQCPICQNYRELNNLGICEKCSEQLERYYDNYNLPYVDKLISTYSYNNFSKKLINRYKLEEQRYLSKLFAKIVLEIIKNADIGIDYVTWIPARRIAKSQRGFDHAADIAKQLARYLDLPCESFLKLNKRQMAQKDLTAKERLLNVEDGFICDREFSVGERILVVDDIITTGATMQNAAKALLKSNPKIIIYAMAVFYTKY